MRPLAAVLAAALGCSLLSPSVASAKRYSVLIDSTPAGATVYLDHKEDGPLGETPYSGRLEDGRYELIFELEGYEPKIMEIEVKRKRSRQRFGARLQRVGNGSVRVVASSGSGATGAEVLVDGERVGRVPGKFSVPAGPHVVEVVPKSGTSVEEWIQVRTGETVTVRPAIEGGDVPDFDDDEDDTELGDVSEDPDDEDPFADPDAEHDDSDADGGSVRDSTDVAGARTYRRAMAVIDVGLLLAGRAFAYGGGQSSNLRPYDVMGVPMFHVAVELYPLTRRSAESERSFGIVGGFAEAFGLDSKDSEGRVIDTQWSERFVGGRVRYLPSPKLLLGGGVGYGRVAFRFDELSALFSEVPDVSYSFLRFGIDLRYGSDSCAVIAGASLLGVLDAGTVAARFSDTTTYGLSGEGGVACGVGEGIELRAVGNYRGMFYAFDPDVGDEYVAASASDHMFSLSLSGAYIY